MNDKRWSPLEILAIALVLVLFVGLVAYGAAGLRGSDQYWYTADVASLIHGRGATTNNVFPMAAYRPAVKLPRPFVHNILNTYLAAPFALALGPYRGWIALNLLGSLLAALAIFFTVRRYAARPWALLAASSYLLLPLTIWQTTQPLAEASTTALVALTMLTYVAARSSFGYSLALTLLAGLLFYCRQSFSPLLIIIPVAAAFRRTPSRVIALLQSFILLALASLLTILAGRLFPQYVDIGPRHLFGALLSAPTRKAGFPFGLVPYRTSVPDLIRDVLFQIRLDWKPLKISSLATYVTVVLAGVGLWLAVRRKWLNRRIAFSLILLVLLEGTVSLLHQYEPRYLLLLAPVLIVTVTILVSFFVHRSSLFGHRLSFIVHRSSFLSIPFLLVLVVALPIDLRLDRQSRKSAAYFRSLNSAFSASADSIIPRDDAVMIDCVSSVGLGSYIWVGYALRPRYVLFVPNYYPADVYTRLQTNLHARWLLAGSSSSLVPGYLGLTAGSGLRFPPPNDSLMLYRLP
jgi:hypothetical protein